MYIKEPYSYQQLIEKSRFIAYLFPIVTEQDFKDQLLKIKKEHHDANHVASALVLPTVKRSNDDQEPASSAGMPILKALENKQLENCAIAVVRYFGGIKLGIPGLIKAYGSSAQRVIEQATIFEKKSYHKYALTLNYQAANNCAYFLEKNTLIIEKNYDQEVTFIFACNSEKTLRKIAELTRGNKANYLGELEIENKVELSHGNSK